MMIGESRWCEELQRRPGQAHAHAVSVRAPIRVPAAQGSCECSGQRVCCGGATDNHLPRPQGYSAWTSGPHYKLGGLLAMKTP